MKKRRNHDAGCKARVAIEALKGKRTVSELEAEYGMQSNNDPPMNEGVARRCGGYLRAGQPKGCGG